DLGLDRVLGGAERLPEAALGCAHHRRACGGRGSERGPPLRRPVPFARRGLPLAPRVERGARAAPLRGRREPGHRGRLGCALERAWGARRRRLGRGPGRGRVLLATRGGGGPAESLHVPRSRRRRHMSAQPVPEAWLLEQLLAETPDAALAFDREYRYRYWN